jgi:ureidoglycolate lyase
MVYPKARHRIRVEQLTSKGFAPFGEVIEYPASDSGRLINGGTSIRYDDVAKLDLVRAGGRPLLSLFRTQPCDLPLAITMLERHPLSSQAFIPLSVHPFLVVAAPPAEKIAPDAIRAFRAAPGQGVNYAAGVWHHPLLALEAETDFLVIGRGGDDENCDLQDIDSLEITLEI